MHVVVTGAAGFIGSHTCERLVGAGHRVTGIDSFDGYLYPAEVKRRNALELARLPAERFRLVEADICDPDAVARVIGERRRRGVSPRGARRRAALARRAAALPADQHRPGTGVIVERMRALGLQRLVFASSSSVYGAKPGAVEAFREDDPCLHAGLAVRGDQADERAAAVDVPRPVRDRRVRAALLHGVRPAAAPRHGDRKFIEAIAAERPITVFGDGSSRRDYTFIDDIVAGTVAAIERVEPRRYELYNLGGTHTISLAELVETIERVVGKRAVIARQPEQPGDVPVTFANIDRARAALGYEPTTRIEDGIARQWAWIRASR